MSKTRPDLFVHTVNMLRYGEAAEELSEKLAECIDAARNTGKAATIKLEIKIKPKRNSGQHFLEDSISVSLPKPERVETIVFEDKDGNLTREDPRQIKMNLRPVQDEQAPVRSVEEAAAAIKAV